MRQSAQTKPSRAAVAKRYASGASVLACHIEAIRQQCCEAIRLLRSGKPLDELRLRRCAELGHSLCSAQQLLHSTVAYIAISRIKRRSRNQL